MQMKARRTDLDCAKGLGILLVVAGHLVPASAQFPEGNSWYLYLREVLYEFHMPFFMYLSGYVTFLSGAAYTSPDRWANLLRRRASRLLLPFLIFGLGIVAGKYLASQLFHVDNLPNSVSRGLIGLIWTTDDSPATSVWYVAVLFVFCIATPPLLWLSRERLLPVVLGALCLYFAPMPHVLYLDRVATYLVFFVIGGACVQREAAWLAVLDRRAWSLLAVFVFVAVAFPFTQIIDWHVKVLIVGTLSMPALHGLVRHRPFRDSAPLLWFGAFSFVIYLLNTPFIGLIKGAMLRFVPWDGPAFLLYAGLMMVGGTLGPIMVKRCIFRFVPAIDRMTD